MLFKLVGGIGLFLMGMVMLTDGLKAFAGDSLRTALLRFTGSPAKSFVAGTLVTLMVQSSSAATVAVIGFVSAGVLAFPQALGFVFGASLGATGMGWIVAVLGLKVSVGFYALPLVGVGALLNLLSRGRWRPFGVALAGFGLIFIGIETLQDAMQRLSVVIDLSSMPSAGFFGHLLMMGIGLFLTVAMQSSGAAVATTMTALHTNSIQFEQAASLVIGAAVGTTVTGALAAIGGSVGAKRTALAHVLFNLFTGLIAVVILPVLLWGIREAQENFGLDPGAMSLAAFHTTFIAIGVVIFLPFVNRFAALIERLLPEKGATLTRHLDPTVLSVPAVALETTRRALGEIAIETFTELERRLADGKALENPAANARIQEALGRTKDFFAEIPATSESAMVSPLRETQIHAIEHLTRLQSFLRPPASLRKTITHPRLQNELGMLLTILREASAGLKRVPIWACKDDAPECEERKIPETEDADEGTANGESATGKKWIKKIKRKSAKLSVLRRDARPAVLRETAAGDWDPKAALEILDAMRWLDSVGYHVWRITKYLGGDPKPEVEDGDGESLPGE